LTPSVTATDADPGREATLVPTAVGDGGRASTAPSEQVAVRVAAERDVAVRDLPSLWETFGLDLEALDRLFAGDRDVDDLVVHLEVDGVRLRVSTDGVTLVDR
jgi:hypothetical protein